MVNEFVDKTYFNAPYAQYGNCGEGSLVTLCLALRKGYKPADIRYCEAGTPPESHVFSAVRADSSDQWCVMDRWDLIGRGHFFCGVSWNVGERSMLIDAIRPTHAWYQNVRCQSASDLRL